MQRDEIFNYRVMEEVSRVLLEGGSMCGVRAEMAGDCIMGV